jgi:hypothetical protein
MILHRLPRNLLTPLPLRRRFGRWPTVYELHLAIKSPRKRWGYY